jgi:hypothetical protein
MIANGKIKKGSADAILKLRRPNRATQQHKAANPCEPFGTAPCGGRSWELAPHDAPCSLAAGSIEFLNLYFLLRHQDFRFLQQTLAMPIAEKRREASACNRSAKSRELEMALDNASTL